MTVAESAQRIHLAFPQIYHACHTRHERRRSAQHRLSVRDAMILAHLDDRNPTVQAELARHLSITKSTLSEAIKRLATLGYVASICEDRRRGVVLTARGLAAVQDASVLESDRLNTVLRRLRPAERKLVSDALTLLADACRWKGQTAKGRKGADMTSNSPQPMASG